MIPAKIPTSGRNPVSASQEASGWPNPWDASRSTNFQDTAPADFAKVYKVYNV
jgi:hypothetical protein